MVTAEQWEKINDKYGDLIYKVSYMITGDAAICSIEDNAQDLRIAAMEAVDGFERQHGGANGKFDDFWGSKGFDQYIKTCIWTRKHSKGSRVQKRVGLTKGTVPTDIEEVLMLEESYSPQDSLHIEDFAKSLSSDEQSIIKEVCFDPSLIKANGKFNLARIAENLDVPVHHISKVVNGMSKNFENEF